jgi:sigma-B regulation protein RsbU (phosphoserine phosphatase)
LDDRVRIEHTAERVSQVIFEYAARIAQEQDTGKLLQLNADMARDLVGADRCSIWLVDANSGQLHTTVAHGVGEIRVDLGDGLVGACVAQAQSVLVNDTSKDDRFLNRVDQGSGYVTQSVLAIPLCAAEGNVIGAFQAVNKPGGFLESDVALLGLAGSYSAAAIETQRLRKEAEAARMFLRELEIAREVQNGLLPQGLPVLHGLDCAAFFRPAKLVGGDYYDFIQTPSGALGFTLGDVSGKGIPAAVLMASIQASLRIPLRNGPKSLTELVGELNDSVRASSTGRYSTLFCGLVDPHTWQITYVNAGQCAPMLIRRRGHGVVIERLNVGGTPIGLLPRAAYDEGTAVLTSGDLLVCFSDGISEACNSREEFWNESAMEDVLREGLGSTAERTVQSLVRAADSFVGDAEQADDMTIIALRAP